MLTVHTPTTCTLITNVKLFWQESVWSPASCEAETTKESIKTKTEERKRERERQRKRESKETGQRSSTRKRARARYKKQRRHFLLEEQHEILQHW